MQSPNASSLNTSTNLRLGGNNRRRVIKNQALKDKEKKIRNQELDNDSDFIDYLEFLVDFYTTLEKLDSAG